MARPTRVAAEDIEQAAVNLVRANGLSALTARGVADALGVSTQPVYSSWGSMDALRERVDERVRAFIQTYLAQPEPGAPPMLSLGLRTVR
ncbi:MAG: TetR family transcriptional regulator, partial [Candidatus Phosphoribacter baldrii]